MTEGEYYHIFNRGNNSDRIFYETENYDYFIRKFRLYLDDYLDVFSFCLMPTHFHFLVRIRERKNESIPNPPEKNYLTPIEKAFKDFFISYAKSINKKYNRTGSLFQYKFKRKHITDEIYLQNIVRYIHLNPVESGLCLFPYEYKYSSYHSIVEQNNSWIRSDEVIELFSDIGSFISFHQQIDESPNQDYKSF